MTNDILGAFAAFLSPYAPSPGLIYGELAIKSVGGTRTSFIDGSVLTLIKYEITLSLNENTAPYASGSNLNAEAYKACMELASYINTQNELGNRPNFGLGTYTESIRASVLPERTGEGRYRLECEVTAVSC